METHKILHVDSKPNHLDHAGGVLHVAAEGLVVVLLADHGHGAVLAQAPALLTQRNVRKIIF